MKKSKKNEQKKEEIRLWLYNKGSYIQKSKSHFQVGIGAKDSGGVGKSLVRWKNGKKTAPNLPKVYQKDNKAIERSLQSTLG